MPNIHSWSLCSVNHYHETLPHALCQSVQEATRQSRNIKSNQLLQALPHMSHNRRGHSPRSGVFSTPTDCESRETLPAEETRQLHADLVALRKQRLREHLMRAQHSRRKVPTKALRRVLLDKQQERDMDEAKQGAAVSDKLLTPSDALHAEEGVVEFRRRFQQQQAHIQEYCTHFRKWAWLVMKPMFVKSVDQEVTAPVINSDMIVADGVAYSASFNFLMRILPKDEAYFSMGFIDVLVMNIHGHIHCVLTDSLDGMKGLICEQKEGVLMLGPHTWIEDLPGASRKSAETHRIRMQIPLEALDTMWVCPDWWCMPRTGVDDDGFPFSCVPSTLPSRNIVSMAAFETLIPDATQRMELLHWTASQIDACKVQLPQWKQTLLDNERLLADREAMSAARTAAGMLSKPRTALAPGLV